MKKVILFGLIFISMILPTVGAIEIFDVIESGSIEKVKLAIAEGADVNARDDGFTPLMFAYKMIFERVFDESQGLELVSLLIDAGADVNARVFNGFPAFLYSYTCDSPTFLKKMLEAGAHVNARFMGGFNSLIFLISESRRSEIDLEMLSALIKADININARDENGMTALMHASQRKHFEALSLLLEAGADASKIDKNGNTAYDYAIKHHDDWYDTEELWILGDAHWEMMDKMFDSYENFFRSFR